MRTIREEFEKNIKNPHDAAFKNALQRKELARSFFRCYFPDKIVRKIDLASLDLRNKSYVDEKLRDRHSDIVYRTKIKNSDAFLYVLFEHQSAPDRLFIFRLLCYMINLWKEYIDQNPKTQSLPVVLPAVLYHGEKEWNSPDRLWKLFDGGDDFREYIPEFSFNLYNLADYEDESLFLGDSMALGVVLYLMKHIFDRDFGPVFIRVVEYLKKVGDKKTQLEFLEFALRYTYHARNEDKPVVKQYIEQGIERINEESFRRLAMTVAEQLKQEGFDEGIKEGIKEGEKKFLFKMLNHRFGYIPPEILKKLQNADDDLLDKFGKSLFELEDLKEVEKWWMEN